MNKFFISIFFLVAANYSNAQSPNVIAERQVYYNTLAQTTKTLVIDVSKAGIKNSENLKDELSSWKEKVISIDLDDKTNRLTIVHNGLLDPRELNEVLDKHQIAKKNIISHK